MQRSSDNRLLARFLGNHVLANLTFAVVLVMGAISYLDLPRQQDPTINFNWIDITTVYPGASSEDVEKQVTDVLEDAIANLDDVRFVSSTSREGVSSILVRFEDIDERSFERRLNDLRRELQNQQSELPEAAEDPRIIEFTSSNAFPVATLVVSGPAEDENLRRQARTIEQDLERLAGTFWLLSALGQTLNVTVLLGVVISLGMLIDDAVVVVEAIYYRLQRGLDALSATLDALHEVFAPVTTAVLTTMAAFLPLMLLPGILGKFMLVIPLVVTAALAISLIEAYWMLPAHIIASRVNLQRPGRIQRWRTRFLHGLRIRYTRLLIRVLYRPKTALAGVLLMVLAAGGALAGGLIRFDFFASDPLRLFYIYIELPAGTPLERTLDQALAVERRVKVHLEPEETRAVVSYAGQMFTDIAPRFGDQYGQTLVGLQPQHDELRDVDAIIEAMRADVLDAPKGVAVSFLRLAGGPPTAKPISVKVRGNDLDELRAAVAELKAVMATDPAFRDISDDDVRGLRQLNLRIDHDAARRAGVDPLLLARAIRLLGDGEVVTSLQDRGETVEVRVLADPQRYDSIEQLLNLTLPLPDGARMPLSELVSTEVDRGEGNIRHYNRPLEKVLICPQRSGYAI